MTVAVVPYRIGCQPSSVPGEVVLQDGWSTFVIFEAVSESLGPTGFLDDKGIAVVECVGCSSAKYGYPNDEGLPEHPLYALGLADVDPIVEIQGSEWVQQILGQQLASSNRIWGTHGTEVSVSKGDRRHFLIRLKEGTFECIARELSVRLYAKSHAEAFEFVRLLFADHS